MKIGMQGSVLRPLQTLFSVGSVGGLTDGQLLEEFLSRRNTGAEAAFAALVALHGPMVWNVCQSVLAESHAAEDAFQATFLILVRKAGSIRHRDTLGAWLYGVARRVAVRAKRDAARRQRHEGQGTEMDAASRAAGDPSQREQLELLHQELDRLPEKYRTAVILCHLEGRTHADAARLLKCPVGTVSVRVARARELLRARLTRRGLALPAALAGMVLLPQAAKAAAIPSGLAESTIKVAMQVAAGKTTAAGAVSVAVARLTEGVIKTMSMTKLAVTATGVLVAGSAMAGAGLLAQINSRPGPVAPAPAPERKAADDLETEARAKSMNNLMQIALAMHNFASNAALSNFPPAAIRKEGKPLLSWRVALLPHLDQKALYEKFHLDEPWDSPHNKTLLDQMPEFYAPVINIKDGPKYTTYYQVLVGPGALFDDEGGGPRLKNIKDGTANTIMVVEASQPVPWTKPEDVPFDKEKPLPKLGGVFKEGFNAAFADGSARFLSKKLSEKVLRAAITSNGGEFLGGDSFDP
jgi:RNA polymerase sigma factor (sigma-70 family)